MGGDFMAENCSPGECLLEARVSALERANERHGQTHGEMFDRIRHLERSDAVQEQMFKSIDEKLDTLLSWKDEEQEKPGTLLNRLKEHALSLIIGAVLGYAAVRLGLTA